MIQNSAHLPGSNRSYFTLSPNLGSSATWQQRRRCCNGNPPFMSSQYQTCINMCSTSIFRYIGFLLKVDQINKTSRFCWQILPPTTRHKHGRCLSWTDPARGMPTEPSDATCRSKIPMAKKFEAEGWSGWIYIYIYTNKKPPSFCALYLVSLTLPPTSKVLHFGTRMNI